MTPKIWTPLSRPVCPDCGRLRRDYLHKNRHRLGTGFLMGGACCCGYILSECAPATGHDTTYVYTLTDLSDYLSSIVKIQGYDYCFTVAKINLLTPPYPLQPVVVTSTWGACNVCVCYKLTPCYGGPVLYTRSDLSDEVGNVILISGVCYVISQDDAGCTNPQNVSGTIYSNCSQCKTIGGGDGGAGASSSSSGEESSSSAGDEPCTDCAGATNVPTVTGWTGACAVMNSSITAYTFTAFGTFSVASGTGCYWQFDQPLFASLTVFHWLTVTGVTESCGFTPQAGDYAVQNILDDNAFELTPGIRCNGSALAGAHTYSSPICTNDCGNTPSVSF